MFLLNFFLRGKQDPICLRYSTADSANDAAASIEGQSPVIRLVDDYGVSVSIVEKDVSAMVTIDVAKEQAGAGEIVLMNARANAKLNSKAMADPELQAAQRMGQLMGMNRQ